MKDNGLITPAMVRAEAVLTKHRVGSEYDEARGPQRPKAAIDAIIRDVRKANAKAGA